MTRGAVPAADGSAGHRARYGPSHTAPAAHPGGWCRCLSHSRKVMRTSGNGSCTWKPRASTTGITGLPKSITPRRCPAHRSPLTPRGGRSPRHQLRGGCWVSGAEPRRRSRRPAWLRPPVPAHHRSRTGRGRTTRLAPPGQQAHGLVGGGHDLGAVRAPRARSPPGGLPAGVRDRASAGREAPSATAQPGTAVHRGSRPRSHRPARRAVPGNGVPSSRAMVRSSASSIPGSGGCSSWRSHACWPYRPVRPRPPPADRAAGRRGAGCRTRGPPASGRVPRATSTAAGPRSPRTCRRGSPGCSCRPGSPGRPGCAHGTARCPRSGSAPGPRPG